MQNGNIITWHSASLKGNKNSFLSSCITVYLFLLRHESFKFLFFVWWPRHKGQLISKANFKVFIWTKKELRWKKRFMKPWKPSHILFSIELVLLIHRTLDQKTKSRWTLCRMKRFIKPWKSSDVLFSINYVGSWYLIRTLLCSYLL